MQKMIMLICFALACLTACETTTSAPDTATSTPTISAPPPTQAFDLDERRQLEALYDDLVIAQQQAREVWQTLSDGGDVPCTTSIDAPDPARFQGEGIYEDMRFVALELTQAATLWNRECANPRPQVPPEVIGQGLLSVRTAIARLDDVQRQLRAN